MLKINKSIILVLLGFVFTTCAMKDQVAIKLIPYPSEIGIGKGSFRITDQIRVSASDPSLSSIQSQFLEGVSAITDLQLQLSSDQGDIHLELDQSLKDQCGSEGYTLSIGRKKLNLQAATEAGLFYGTQTILQLINDEAKIPVCEINDVPRFEWRGFMLDVSRHFFPKEYILKLIDHLALHKLNTLHLHLVDDQGWRLEIKQYPKLTEVGAWRVDREHLHWSAREAQKPHEKASYGGFFTQDDIKEIVAYAASRQITVVPEIEMPGHTTAALAAYPELSCTGGPFTVLPGGIWPITDIYCAGKEETFEFIENVLTEVLDLFPSTYIHIGGDEANKAEWEQCPDCQARIKEEGLQDEHELQSYFISRIEQFLNAKGRQLIGWDEILEGGLAPNAAVMSWRGMQGGITAAKSGHPVVMTPTSHCYFDYYQGQPELEPQAFGGYLPLEKVYSFNPIPTELSFDEAQFVKGVQANLWTEHVDNADHADYMAFPRLCALAEVAWSPENQRDFEHFSQRLRQHLPLLDQRGIHYARSFANVALGTDFNLEKREFTVQLENALDLGSIYYSLDGTDPTPSSNIYSQAFSLNETTLVKAVTVVDGQVYSGIASEKVWIHQGTGASVSYLLPYHDKYPAQGDQSLSNSLRGSVNLSDGRWQGFEGDDLQVVLDLGAEKNISKVYLGCLQAVGSWVFFPKSVQVFGSSDGQNFEELGSCENKISLKDPNRQIQDFTVNFEPQSIRFIKVFAYNQGTCPDWHAGAGNPCWLFVDEIIVE